MSLVIVLTDRDKNILCVASDSRGTSTTDGPQAGIFEKLRIINHAGQNCVVAIAGEAELNGIRLLDYASEHAVSLFNKDGIDEFRNFLSDMWKKDVLFYPWENEDDKSSYLKSAKITLLIAPKVDSIYMIDGTYSQLQLTDISPHSPIAFGQPDLVTDLLKTGHESFENWNRYLASIFTKASQKSASIAAPIDVVLWNSNSLPLVEQFSLEELKQKPVER